MRPFRASKHQAHIVSLVWPGRPGGGSKWYYYVRLLAISSLIWEGEEVAEFHSKLTCVQVIGFVIGIIKMRVLFTVQGCIQVLRPYSACSCTERRVIVHARLCLLLLQRELCQITECQSCLLSSLCSSTPAGLGPGPRCSWASAAQRRATWERTDKGMLV